MTSLSVAGAVEAPLVTGDRTCGMRELLARARPVASADHATVVSGADGYRASIPLDDLARGSLDDGRLTIPSGLTLCWNVKDVVRVEVTVGKQPDDVPEKPPH
ncbi:MAG TPA: hypothetical protein VF230_15340 [Acidimicrobiales bacterium]